MNHSKLRSKLLVAAASTLVFGAAALWIHRATRTQADSVEVFDDPEALRSAITEGAEGTDPETLDDREFVLGELKQEHALSFYPSAARSKLWLYDPQVYFRRAGNSDYQRGFREHPDRGWRVHTNSYGMREDDEPMDPAPALRILVLGDSHIDGVVPNAESAPNQLEALLIADGADSVEVLNAGQGCYSLQNYARSYERYRELRPDVFLVIIYGGNDFYEACRLDRYFRGDAPHRTGPYHFEASKLESGPGSLLPQELAQECYFQNNPDDFERAIGLLVGFTRHIRALAEADGCTPLFVYLPPPLRGQPDVYDPTLDLFRVLSRMDLEQLGVSDRIADAWIAAVAEDGTEVLDLRAEFTRHTDPLYWHDDHHLNTYGCRVVAERLRDRLAEDVED